MSKIIKGNLSLSIGLSNAEQNDTFELEVDDNCTNEEINQIVQDCWNNWTYNYIDGGGFITSIEEV